MRVILIEANKPPVIAEAEVKENILYIEGIRIELNSNDLEKVQLKDNIYAIYLNPKNIYKDEEGICWCTKSPYPLDKNIKIGEQTIYGDIIVANIYNDKLYPLNLREVDVAIGVLAG